MAISSENNRNDAVGGDSTATYNYTFRITSESHLLVTVKNPTTDVETTLTIDTDYTVSGVGDSSGGSIVLVDAGQDWISASSYLDTSWTITIRRDVDIVQETDIRNQGDFFPEVHEDAFDYLTFIDQQQQDEIDRSVKNPESLPSSSFDPTLPTDINTASSALVTNPSGTGFVVGPTTSEISGAAASATAADASATLAQNWATKVDGQVASTDYSSKAWSIGGTGVTETASAGAAKEWATKTDNPVDTSEYSAKEWARGIQTRGVASSGSSKDWANYTAGTVDDTEYSAKYYANQAATSASDAATSAAASQWNDVVYVTSGDSPVSVVDASSGTLYSVDTSGGAVTFNLPSIAGLTLSGAWSIAIKKTDSSSNAITVNRDGTDTIGGSATKTILRQFEGSSFIPDTDGTPDDWTTLTFGEVPISGDIVGTTDTQDLSAKTFTDAITLEEQGSTPSTPASGDKKFYAKTDGKLYSLDSGGNEIEVGAGGGGGGVQYINEDFETGVTNLVAYADVAGATPVDGTGGTPNVTVTAEASSQLIGTTSAKITKDAANRQGEGVAIVSETIDTAYTDKVHTVEFLWKPDATVVADALKLFVVHPTTGTVEALNFRTALGEYTNSLPTDSSTTHRIVSELTPIDSTYRIVIHVAGTDTTAYTGLVDNIQCGPQRTFNAPIVTEWETTTATGTHTANVAYACKSRRVGDSLEVTVDLNYSGATTATDLLLTIPNGLTIDTSKLASGTFSNIQQVGEGTFLDAGVTVYEFLVGLSTSTTLQVYYKSGTSSYAVVSNTAPVTIASGDRASMTYKVPISGWDAGAAFSTTQVDQQTVKARLIASGGSQTVTAGATSEINFGAIDYDTHGIASVANNSITIPKSGYYYIGAAVAMETAGTGEDRYTLLIRGDGGSILSGYGTVSADGTNGPNVSDIQYIEAGVEITVDIQNSDNVSHDVSQNGFVTFLTVVAQPDFSVFGTFPEKNLVQTKTLSANVSSDITMSDLTFSNLTVGKWYDIKGQFFLAVNQSATNTTVYVEATHNSTVIASPYFQVSTASDTQDDYVVLSINTSFQATATTLTFVAQSATATSTVAGNGTRSQTFIQLEERNDLRETSKF
jgi:hypothetical protein